MPGRQPLKGALPEKRPQPYHHRPFSALICGLPGERINQPAMRGDTVKVTVADPGHGRHGDGRADRAAPGFVSR